MAAVKKSKVTVNIGKNRLQIAFAGKISKKTLNDIYTDIRFSVADLKPGFDVVADFLDAHIFVLEGIPTFRKITHYLASNGAGNIVRILDSERLAETQLGNLVSRTQGYMPIVASSQEDAEEKLEKYQQRNGLRIYLFHAPVEYHLGEEKGDGDIKNISISGCAIESASIMPKVDDEIQVTLSFLRDVEMSNIIEVNARVVRTEGDSDFAVQFTNIDDTQKDELWKILLVELQDEMI